MDCKHEMQLRSGTVMQGSHLPVRDWFACHVPSDGDKACHIHQGDTAPDWPQSVTRPVWEMVHKLRDVMGKRDGGYPLHGDMEVDEGFFSTETPEEQKDCPLKRGRGSQRKTSVLVMAESSLPKTPPTNKYSTPRVSGI